MCFGPGYSAPSLCAFCTAKIPHTGPYRRQRSSYSLGTTRLKTVRQTVRQNAMHLPIHPFILP